MYIDRQTLYIIIGGLLVVGLFLGIYSFSGSKTKKEKFNSRGSSTKDQPEDENESPETAEDEESEPVTILFWATWCPHCKGVKPVWEEVMDRHQGKNMDIIEASDSRAKHFGSMGYPTIRHFPEGRKNPTKFEDYKGPRDTVNVEKFYTSHSQ